MRTFKKALISLVCLLCCVAILSVAIITPRFIKESAYFCDRSLRRELAGSIDTIVLGASHALCAIQPTVLDEALGCNSYNLSAANMPASAKMHLLDKELDRNPVKTVYLEVSYNTLTRDIMKEYGDGDSTTLIRLDSLPEAMGYMFRYIRLENWMNIYSRLLQEGLVYWKNVLLREPMNGVDREAKGFWSKKPVDLSVSPDELAELHNSKTVKMDFIDSEVDALRHQIDSCRRHGAEVTLIVTPVSDRLLWQNSGWDEFRDWLADFGAENGCEVYDFNLLKERYALFRDSESFFELGHMSQTGAAEFSPVFADVIRRINAGEDVSALFYDNYAQMLEDSPYMQQLSARQEAEAAPAGR